MTSEHNGDYLNLYRLYCTFLCRFCRSRALAEGMLETKPIEEVKPGIEFLSKLAKEKIDKNWKTGRAQEFRCK